MLNLTKKKRILLCWGYNRKNWIDFFESLNSDFEFVYLFYMYPDEETNVYTENRRIFYTQFSTPKKLLNEIKPDKVVFMGLDGLQVMALNIQCKKTGIPTFFMAHGSATLSLEDYENYENNKRNLLKEAFSRKIHSWLFTFKFLISALGMKYIYKLPLFIKFQVQKLFMHPILALNRNKTPLRNPDKYILFSKPDMDFILKQDDCKPGDIILLGNLEITGFIEQEKKTGVNRNGYLLYIETPLSVIEGNTFDVNILTKEAYNQFIEALNNYALGKGLQLVIKLHPYSFTNTFMFKHENIIYEKEGEKERLILDADAVIFYNSSLAVPALLYKPCCMFTIGKLDDFQEQIKQMNACYVCDHTEFIKEPAKVSFIGSVYDKQKFIDKYIGAGVDGKGIERLRQVFLN